jgi:hypothetical protein
LMFIALKIVRCNGLRNPCAFNHQAGLNPKGPMPRTSIPRTPSENRF